MLEFLVVCLNSILNEDIGMCNTAVVSICGDGLTLGIEQKTSPSRVDLGNVVPQMHIKWWWISSVAGIG
jgi:hypothetical protein